MKKLQDYFLSSENKLLLNSIDGGYLTYLPLHGSVQLYSMDSLSANILSSFGSYYKKAFAIPDFEVNNITDPVLYKTKYSLFDEYPTGNSQFFDLLIRSGIQISEKSSKLNNKFFFQQMVSTILGNKFSTNPELIKKGTPLNEGVRIVSDSLKKYNKMLIKISDENICSLGADHIGLLNAPEDFSNFINEEFSSLEHGKIDIHDNKNLIVDILVEPFKKHSFSPSVTFYLHEENIEFLSINNQILNETTFLASTNVSNPTYQYIYPSLLNSASKLAQSAHSLGGRGFIGFDCIVNENDITYVESNYRTTGSTVPFITAKKAVRFQFETEWLYISNFTYNSTISRFEQLEEYLSSINFLFQSNDLENFQDKIYCVPTFGDRKKDADYVFFGKRMH